LKRRYQTAQWTKALAPLNVERGRTPAADPNLEAGGARASRFKLLRSIAACIVTIDGVFVIRDPVPEKRNCVLYLPTFLFESIVLETGLAV
jgi:hypothetical protein